MRESRLTNFHITVTELANLTTGSNPLKDPSQVTFIMLDEDLIELEIPPRFCAFGHKLSLVLQTTGGKNDTELEGSGAIMELETLEDKRIHLKMKLQNYDTVAMKIIQAELNTIRNDVLKLMNQMKEG